MITVVTEPTAQGLTPEGQEVMVWVNVAVYVAVIVAGEVTGAPDEAQIPVELVTPEVTTVPGSLGAPED